MQIIHSISTFMALQREMWLLKIHVAQLLKGLLMPGDSKYRTWEIGLEKKLYFLVFQLTRRLLRIQAILLGKSWTQRLKSWDYLLSHCFDRSRELGNINRVYSIIAAALGCVLMPPWRLGFDDLQYLLGKVSILILRTRHIGCCAKYTKKNRWASCKVVFLISWNSSIM